MHNRNHDCGERHVPITATVSQSFEDGVSHRLIVAQTVRVQGDEMAQIALQLFQVLQKVITYKNRNHTNEKTL